MQNGGITLLFGLPDANVWLFKKGLVLLGEF